MRCIMCERLYKEENGNEIEGFCSDECKSVYMHIYGPDDLLVCIEQL